MLNRTTINVPPQAAPVVNVKVEAPDAAQAAELHRKIRDNAEAEARTAVIRRVGAHNHLNIAVLKIENRFDTDTRQVRLMFSVNHHDFDMVTDVGSLTDEFELYGNIVAEEIAKKLLGDIKKALYFNHVKRRHGS